MKYLGLEEGGASRSDQPGLAITQSQFNQSARSDRAHIGVTIGQSGSGQRAPKIGYFSVFRSVKVIPIDLS